MDVKIYRDIPLLPDKQIGRIDSKGKVYDVEDEDQEEYIGWVDYDEGEVFDEDDELLGWVEDDGEIVGHYDDGDEEIGYVMEDGEIYGYDEDAEEIYLGKVVDMENAVEGAAAMLIFFDQEQE